MHTQNNLGNFRFTSLNKTCLECFYNGASNVSAHDRQQRSLIIAIAVQNSV